MNIQSKVIRLASINAALTISSLPQHIIEEKKEIMEILSKENLVVVNKDGAFRFTSHENDSLYSESFSDFNS